MATYRITAPDGGTYEITAPDDASQEQVMAYAQANYAQSSGGKQAQQQNSNPTNQAPARSPGPGMLESLGMGAARGVKDVIDTGAGWLASGFDKLAGTREGERVKAMNEAGKADFKRDYGDSTAASIGRVGGNIAATLPVGGLLGAGVRGAGAVTGASRVAEPLAQAIASGGMKAGSMSGAAGLAARATGGAISGGAMAGLVDPESAGTGALIGAAMPVAIKGASHVMGAAAKSLRGPAVPEATRQVAQMAQQAGYVIPPTQVRPSLANRIMEGTAGKISTAQNASARNQEVTNRLARKALGLADDAQLSPEALGGLRKDAGRAYQALRSLGDVVPDASYQKELGNIASTYKGAAQAFPGLADDAVGDLVQTLNVPKFNADGAVDALTLLRDRADAAFAKGDKGVAKATKQAAGVLEDLLERHAQSTGSPDALKALREARQLIAKTYSVEKALNPATGTVSAQKLAAQLQRGKPLSGELRKVAEFGASFPKAAQAVEQMGSLPQISPLDWALGGGASVATASPLPALMMGVRPAARAAALSGPVQRGLLAAPAPAGSGISTGLLSGPSSGGLLQLGVRSAPLLSTSR